MLLRSSWSSFLHIHTFFNLMYMPFGKHLLQIRILDIIFSFFSEQILQHIEIKYKSRVFSLLFKVEKYISSHKLVVYFTKIKTYESLRSFYKNSGIKMSKNYLLSSRRRKS